MYLPGDSDRGEADPTALSTHLRSTPCVSPRHANERDTPLTSRSSQGPGELWLGPALSTPLKAGPRVPSRTEAGRGCGNTKDSRREARESKQPPPLCKIYRVPRPPELPHKTAGVRTMKPYLQNSTQSEGEENKETSVNLPSQPSLPLTTSLSAVLQGNPGPPWWLRW